MAKPAIAEITYPLVGIFDSGNAAERAYQACLEHGYELGQVNVVVSEETRKKLLQSDHEMKAELGTREAAGGELGGPKGGRVGVLVTVLAAVGAAVAVPARTSYTLGCRSFGMPRPTVALACASMSTSSVR